MKRIESKIKIDRDLLSIIIHVTVFKAILELCYFYILSPKWKYLGLSYDFTYIKLLLSYLLTIFTVVRINWKETRTSFVVLQYLCIIMMIPLYSYMALANRDLMFTIECFAAFNVTIEIVEKSPRYIIPKTKNGQLIIRYFCPFFLVLCVILMVRSYGIHFVSLIGSEIYTIRSSQNVSGILAYVFSWSYKIICPFMITLSVYEKNRIRIVFYTCLQIMMFLTTPHKEIVFGIVLIVFTYLGLKKSKFGENLIKILIWGTVILSFLCLVDDKRFLSPITVVGLRLLYGPAGTKFDYFYFFSTNMKLYLSEGLIGRIIGIQYPYSLPSGKLIAQTIYNLKSNSNVGYIAYSYANFGFGGMLIYSYILGKILVLIDSISKNKMSIFIAAIAIYPFSTLNDCDLLTLLLTGGVFLLIIFLWITEGYLNSAFDEFGKYD